tara:strand:- start:61 stop:570 length:510 start_codon:yes stop_codon:yes gene_type:complete
VGQIGKNFESAEDDFHILDAPLHADAARLADYWHQKRGSRAMPDRSDIIPGDIVSLLPNIVIYDVIDEGRDYRVRIFGTALVNLVGEERTGMLVSEFGAKCVPPTDAEAVRRRWMDSMTAAYTSGQPAFVTGRMSSSLRPYIVWHGASCPLSDGSGKATQIIGIMTIDQ